MMFVLLLGTLICRVILLSCSDNVFTRTERKLARSTSANFGFIPFFPIASKQDFINQVAGFLGLGRYDSR